MSAIAVTGLTRRFGGLVAVDDVSMEIAPGEVFGLLGANGAGKTTIIRLLCGTYAPTAGKVRVLGLDPLADAGRLRSRLGYMSQRFSLYRELTIEENLAFYAGIYGHDAEARIPATCEEVGLEQDARGGLVADQPTGIRQRAALAAAILHRPDLVLLDEPTSGVDPLSRGQFWALIGRMAAGGTTVLVTTHAMTEAESCERVALMAAGRIVASGPPAQLIAGTGITILAVEAEPWQEAYHRLKRRWPDAAMHGTRTHVPLRDAGTSERDVREALAGLRVHSVTRKPATLEDAFVWYLSASPA